MATFPALEPIARRWSMGAPTITTQVYAASVVRFMHGKTATGMSLELMFTDLQPQDAALIRSHYQDQEGDFLAFDLALENTAGHASWPFDPDLRWRYSSPPEEIHKDAGLVDVTVNLVGVSLA